MSRTGRDKLRHMNVVGLSGSLRVKSLNSALLRAATELAPAGLELEVGSIRGIPLYDADAEEEAGLPEAVVTLKERVARADGLLLVTPEYNGSIPGVFKNAIDWLSRPASDIGRVFGNKPIGVIGASPGRMGTIGAQTAWLPVFRALGAIPFLGKSAYIGGASRAFDAELRLTDEASQKVLIDYLAAFAVFVERHAPVR